MDGQSDVELMGQAAMGSHQAFAIIYERHVGVMLGLASRWLPRGDDAQALVHDVFLEAWRYVRDYDPERGAPRTCLLLRLRSRASDRRMRASRASAALAAATAGANTTADLAPPSPAMHLRRDVTQGLAQLDPDLRRVLELTYVDGLTAEELGAREGIPVGTVRSRRARGLVKLRALLEAYRAGGPS